jgi:hypothetical protein
MERFKIFELQEARLPYIAGHLAAYLLLKQWGYLFGIEHIMPLT